MKNIKKVFCLCVMVLLFTACENTHETDVLDSITQKPNLNIKELIIFYDGVLALADNGELYALGVNSRGQLGLGDLDSTSEIVKVADNVKDIIDVGSVTFYIDNNNNLYTAGVDYKGGVNSSFVKIFSNVSTARAYFCDLVLDLNGNVYVANGHFSGNYCGLSQVYKDFTKIAEDAKFIFAYDYSNGYVNSNNELFVMKSGENTYSKKIDNVTKISEYNWLISDNTLYEIGSYGDLSVVSDSVVDIDEHELYFKKTDGEYYIFGAYNEIIPIKNILGDVKIKDLLYADNRSEKYIYLDENNKLHLFTPYNQTELEYNVESIDEILLFVK